jgi:hypothetical protein
MYRAEHDLFHRIGRLRFSSADERTCAEVAPVLDDNTARMTAQEFREYLIAHGELDTVQAELDKLGFGVDFVAREVLCASEVTVSRIAMLWQGMPNKHDRKRTHQLLETLSRIGLLAPKGDDETYAPRS